MNNKAIQIENLGKSYSSHKGELWVLKQVSTQIESGSITSIVGPSGSGKTTLLGLCAGLDNSSEGRIKILEKYWDEMNNEQRARFRSENIGFVFQNFELIPTLTALENVQIPLDLLGRKDSLERSKMLLDNVGLKDRMSHYPSELSGGEQQRVAIARAFANSPKILFADEPTGNLDEETGDRIEKLLFELNQEFGTTMILVTHNSSLAQKTNRIIRLKGGQIFSDELTASQTNEV